MKTHARVVVIGGGALGVGLLYFLAKEGWDDVVQQWGQQGWELVQMLDSNGYLTAACFKRPL